MTATQRFIEDAIKGGYEMNKFHALFCKNKDDFTKPLDGILLDPSSWQAVGKARGWTHYDTEDRFFGFANAIWKGKSIEDYLTSIEN